MAAEKRIHNLELKTRVKYMRMKHSNDTEAVKLQHEWERLDRDARHQREKFLQRANEITDFRSKCVRTSGWYGDAIRPRKLEARRFDRNIKSATNKWNYFANGTIDMWENHPQSVVRKPKARPQTANPSVNRQRDDGAADASPAATRPYTAVVVTRAVPNADEEQPIQETQENTTARPRTAVETSQVQSLATGMDLTRLKSAQFRPFRSPRLESERRRRQSGRTKSSIRERLATTKLTDENDQLQTLVGRQTSTLDNDVFDEDQPFSTNPQRVTRRTKATVVSTHAAARPKSVSFSRQNSVAVYARTTSNSKPKPSRSSSKRSSYISDSDDDEKPPESPMVLPIKQSWRMPRFYVKPEDRHKSEDMFLLRRHALLQKQLAQGIRPERVTKKTDLKIQSSFSLASRQNYLNELVQENEQKQTNDKRHESKHDVQQRVDKFLDSLSVFLRENKIRAKDDKYE